MIVSSASHIVTIFCPSTLSQAVKLSAANKLSQASKRTNSALGILETTGWTPAMVALDAMEKSAAVEVWQVELNDFLGTCVKIVGSVDAVSAAIENGHSMAARMRGEPKSTVMARPSPVALDGIESRVEFNPLIQQNVVKEPTQTTLENTMSEAKPSETKTPSVQAADALGFIETQGFTAVFEAVDTACKAARVEVVGKEKLGGGYVTIVIRGDVAAVRAAIDGGVDSLRAWY